MKNRAKVICHMFITLDGNATSDLMWVKRYEYVGDEYNRIMLSEREAFGVGRETLQTDLQVDLSKYSNISVSYQDKEAGKADSSFVFAIDRYGKLRWDSNYYVEEGSVRSRVIEVLTEQVSPEVLAYYDEMDIPYMFAGKEDFDPQIFLEKIPKLYGVNTFVLAGGPLINGIFMKDGTYDALAKKIGVKENLLWMLYALDDGVLHSQKEISEKWKLPKTTVNTLIKERKKNGYVELQAAADDKRELEIILTDEGKKYAAQILKSVYEVEQRALERTLEKCSRTFIDELEMFSVNFHAVLEEQE